MTSLTQTAYYARRAINWIILGIIAYFLLRIIWSLFISLLLIMYPPKPPPSNHKFGKLPAIKFPAVASPSGQLTFTLDTIEGSVPKASGSAFVYFMPQAAPNLMALTKTEKFAERLGFKTDPIPETKNLYRFDDSEYPLRKLRYDIVSNNFIVKYSFEQDLGLFSENNVPGADAGKQEAKSILQTYNLMSQDYNKGNITATYLKLVNDKLIPVSSLSQANAVRIDFFRQPIGNMKLMTPFPDEGTISIIFSGSNNQKKRILQLAYTYWPIDYQTAATYTLKTSTQAWQELQAGLGFIPVYPENNAAVIRQAYLAYYDSYEPQMYLQPIFVFEGDNGFFGYVPAVAPPWTE